MHSIKAHTYALRGSMIMHAYQKFNISVFLLCNCKCKKDERGGWGYFRPTSDSWIVIYTNSCKNSLKIGAPSSSQLQRPLSKSVGSILTINSMDRHIYLRKQTHSKHHWKSTRYKFKLSDSTFNFNRNFMLFNVAFDITLVHFI